MAELYREFISDDARKKSREIDLGVHWHRPNRPFPRYRISWIEATNEVYAVSVIPNENREVTILGKMPFEQASAIADERVFGEFVRDF